jgi:hypothetical protein
MESAPNLYDTLTSILGQESHWLDKRHYQTLAWMVVGLLYSKVVSLTEWADYVDSRAQYAQSTVRRFSRWLHNERILVSDLYGPLIQEAIIDWQEKTVYLALDTSMLWERFYLIRISLVFRGRSVPLVWKVIRHSSSTVGFSHYCELLDRAATLLPAKTQVVFLADRGFADTKLMAYLRDTLHWHWRIRIKSSFYVYRKHHRRIKICNIRLKRGQARFWYNVYLTKGRFGPVHLALAKPHGVKDVWLIVSDDPTEVTTFDEYGFRFDIEESFLDDKSGGFQLPSSQIRSVEALDRLLFVLALAALFLSSQGAAVVDSGKRRWVDPHWFRGQSYLKIGWKWVRRAAIKGSALIHRLWLPAEPDPEPALASRKQLEKRDGRTFSVQFEIFQLYDPSPA